MKGANFQAFFDGVRGWPPRVYFGKVLEVGAVPGLSRPPPKDTPRDYMNDGQNHRRPF